MTPEEQLIAYLKREILQDADADVDLDTPLVSSGLVDSFSLVEVLTEIERIYAVRIPAGRVSAQDLETVRGMAEVARRCGRR